MIVVVLMAMLATASTVSMLMNAMKEYITVMNLPTAQMKSVLLAVLVLSDSLEMALFAKT